MKKIIALLIIALGLGSPEIVAQNSMKNTVIHLQAKASTIWGFTCKHKYKITLGLLGLGLGLSGLIGYKCYQDHCMIERWKNQMIVWKTFEELGILNDAWEAMVDYRRGINPSPQAIAATQIVAAMS